MSTPPSPPTGYAEAQSQELNYPGIEIGMLAVFTAIGWILQRQQPVEALDTVHFIAFAAVAALLMELLHEGCHVLAFATMGIESRVIWQALSVVPMDRFVTKSELTRATLAPLVLLTGPFGVVYLFGGAREVVILAGFALSVNCTLAVLDIAVILRQIRAPSGTLYTFEIESGELDSLWMFEPTNSECARVAA